MSETTIYTSPYVIASEHKVFREGAVVVQSGRIVDVGFKKEILALWNPAKTLHCSGILLPPLINCHTHLELSHLQGISTPVVDSGMTGWIEEVLKYRLQHQISQQDLVEEYTAALQHQNSSGVILLADISNTVTAELPRWCGSTEVCQIVEVIAPTARRTDETLKYVQTLPSTYQVSPHSPYSSSAQLIEVLKKRAQNNSHIFSIHLAESAAETELITNQSGDFRRFLEKRESWDDTLLGNISSEGPAFYLEKLGVLDEKTLCVHCVHISEEEIEVLAEKKVKVCVCPASNIFLGVGKAPLEKILEAGILPGIGTDSIASNERLDMWREMQILRNQYPDIPATKIFAMATQGGAISLHRENDYGTIEKGKKATFLEVMLPDQEKLSDVSVMDTITSGGMPERLSWISPDNAL